MYMGMLYRFTATFPDIVIWLSGIALLLGFRFPMNFNSPYKADSITDFWHRWHISLSTWLRDYLYISLGETAKGKFRTYINLCLTMLSRWFVAWRILEFCDMGGISWSSTGCTKFWRNLLHKPKNGWSKGIWQRFLQWLLLSILFVSAGYFFRNTTFQKLSGYAEADIYSFSSRGIHAVN